MKYLKLILTLVLIVCLVASLAVASGVKGKTPNQKSVDASEFQGAKTTPQAQLEPYQAEVDDRQQAIEDRMQSVPVPLTSGNIKNIRTVDADNLNGTYNVGTGQAFQTLSEMAIALNYGTMTGPVTMLLTDAMYTTPAINIGLTSGASATNTITIQPAAGNAGCVIQVTNSATYGGGLVFTGAKWITLNGDVSGSTEVVGNCPNAAARQLTIQYDPAQSFPTNFRNAPVKIQNGCESVTIQSCIVTSQYNGTMTTALDAISIQTSSTYGPQMDINVRNCDISNAYNGVYSQGISITTYANLASWDKDIRVMGCDIHDVTTKGIFLQNVRNGYVYCNNVTNVIYPVAFSLSSNRLAGIQVNNSNKSTVERNTVDYILYLAKTTSSSTSARAYGIRINGWPVATNCDFNGIITGNRLVNNTITQVQSLNPASGTGFQSFGIEMGGSRTDTLLHNTVHLTPFGGSQTDGAACIQVFGPRNVFLDCGGYGVRLVVKNNLLANEMTDVAFSNVVYRQFMDDGFSDIRATSNYNVLWSPAGEIAPGSTTVLDWQNNADPGTDANSLGYNPKMLAGGRWDVTQPSSASNLCVPWPTVTDDRDSEARSLAASDAGSDEVLADAPAYHDVYASALTSPGPTGAPQGLPFSPIEVVVANTSSNEESNVGVTVNVYTPSGSLDITLTGTPATVPGLGSASYTLSSPVWNPNVAGNWTFEIICSLTGDLDADNDTLRVTRNVAGLGAFPYCTDFDDAGDTDGWFGDGDWGLASVTGGDTKLGGANSGDHSFQTVPGPAGTHYNAANANFLYTPYFNLLTATEGYVSFYQSINLEPEWDRSIVQYSLDTGKTWIKLGVLDDPDGVNWYASTVYLNAAAANGDGCFDIATADLFGLTADMTTGIWASNGDCNLGVPTGGPDGFVYVQMKLPSAVFGQNYVRFRYVAFSDAAATYDGWAIDDFCLTASAPIFAATAAGNAWLDADGDGTNNSELPAEGATVTLAYFGVESATATTDASGNYLFSNLNPGDYSVSIALAGYGVSYPATLTHSFSSNGVDPTTGKDFGLFAGSVSGKKFNDVNDNGQDDSEPGYAGWTIELRSGSCTGAVVLSTTTDANGAYSFNVGPGTYYVTEVEQDGYRATTPTCVTVAVTVGSPDATANFGNFAYGIIEYEATNDLEGNGIKNPGDLTALPSGVFVPFEVYKDGVRIDSAVIGSLTTSKTYTLLDVGEYVFIQLEVASGWKVTNGTGNDTVVISSSGINALVTQLHFKYPSVSGTKFNDLDGDGTKDAGEPGIEGWTINVSGATPSGGTVLTDANGAYTVFVDSGNHTVTEGTVAGWSRTTPVSGSYTFLALSGTVPGANKVNQNFGNFQNYSVGGTVYRDYNGDGIVNGSDAPMSAEVTFGASSSTGSTFTFSDVSFGAKTLAVTIPSGFVCTSPAGGNYAIPGASGMNLTGKDFLLFQSSDGSILYRTFTLDSLQAHMSKKAVARKLPNIPNLVNMLAEIFKQAKDSSLATGIIVGEAGNLLDPANAKSKEKGYVKPAKEGDVMGSLYKKGKTGALYQTGTARGLDFLVKNEARILKLNKSLGPDKHSNVLFGNLMTLAVNIASADFEKTPAGFGDLKYVGPYEAWDGMTPRQILAAANDKMSNWEFVPASTFSDMNTAVAAINAEFSSATLDSASFIVGGKLSWTGVKPVSQSNLFVANPGAAPYQRPYEEHPPTPTAFSLNQNYPNPFNPTTTISFELAEPAIVTVKVFNMLGQEVATVLDREEFFDGVYSEAFDASGLTSGVYFYQIITDVTNEETGASQHFTQTKKMLLAK